MDLSEGQIIEKASQIRESIIKMLVEAGSGHSAGSLGTADFFASLFFGDEFNFKADEPWWEGRDRLILSAGHLVPVLYASLAEAGYFDKKELDTLRDINSRLQGHPHMRSLPGIENSSGPLGQGVSQAVGVAMTGKMDKKDWQVVCFSSDGEQQEGQVWEAYMTASKYELGNLSFVIDRNNIQIDGFTEEVMPLEPLRSKLSAFGLEVMVVDGHDVGSILGALRKVKISFKPSVIILETVPGKGVEFMEGLPEWHGKPPDVGETVKALSDIHELRSLGGKIMTEHD